MTITLATFLCRDTNTFQASSWYPAVGKKISPNLRRTIYWQNIVVNLSSARRCVPDARLCVLTNDADDLDLGGAMLHRTLDELHVERIHVPFELFCPPPNASFKFYNIFYRFDVIQWAGENLSARDALILYDGDCVWANRVEELAQRIPRDGLWLSTPRELFPPYLRYPYNQSRADFGALYKKINPAYPEPFPRYYGGEFIGGGKTAFHCLSAQLQTLWQRVLAMNAQAPLHLANGESIFDNDEYIFNYVYNSGEMPVTLASGFVRRIQTLEGLRDVNPADEKLALWHLVSEKRRGLLLLLPQVLEKQSAFWNIQVEQLTKYIGAYVGIPQRQYDVARTPLERAEMRGRAAWRRLRELRERAKANLS